MKPTAPSPIQTLSHEAAEAIRRNPPKVMTTLEARAYLRVCRNKFQELIRQKLIPQVRVGRVVSYRLQDLEAFQDRMLVR